MGVEASQLKPRGARASERTPYGDVAGTTACGLVDLTLHLEVARTAVLGETPDLVGTLLGE